MDDDATYGLSKNDAGEVINLIGHEDVPFVEGRGVRTTCLYGKTKPAGLNVGTPANVLLYDVDGTLTADELLAETRVSNIPADTEIVLFAAYGRWLALRLC